MAVAEANIRPGGETLLVLAATGVLSLVLIESSGVVAAASLALLAVLPAIAVSLCVVAHRWNLHCLHMSVCAIVFGSIGVLVGARLDFGQFGLITIADWCRVLQPVSLDAIRAQVASAPWTHAGMLGGCNLGLLLSTRFADQAVATRPVVILRFAGCNAGMILGMLVAEAMRTASDYVVADVPAAARLFLVMVLGMAAGMWSGWWCAKWTIRGWRRWARPLASQHDWRSATGRA